MKNKKMGAAFFECFMRNNFAKLAQAKELSLSVKRGQRGLSLP